MLGQKRCHVNLVLSQPQTCKRKRPPGQSDCIRRNDYNIHLQMMEECSQVWSLCSDTTADDDKKMCCDFGTKGRTNYKLGKVRSTANTRSAATNKYSKTEGQRSRS